MQNQRSETPSRVIPGASFQPALLFLVATALLVFMSFPLEPGVALPLVAFAAMATLTFLLAQRLFGELTASSVKGK